MAVQLMSRVLILDDDEDIPNLLRMLFEVEGFAVVGEARNGCEAVPHAIAYDPDVVVLDYLMPFQGGEKTAHILRTVVPEVKIVAFSAALDARPTWADAYLSKDRVGELVSLLVDLLAEMVRPRRMVPDFPSVAPL